MVLENCRTSDVKINPEKKKSFKNMNYRELSLKASKFEMCIGSNCNEESKKGLNSNLIIFLLQNNKKGEQNLCLWSTRSDLRD